MSGKLILVIEEVKKPKWVSTTVWCIPIIAGAKDQMSVSASVRVSGLAMHGLTFGILHGEVNLLFTQTVFFIGWGL